MSDTAASRSDWVRLLRIARNLIGQVNSDHQIVDHWSLGGGTAMMLQIDHRESHDVDVFLDDPQLLPYLSPATHDFAFELDLQGHWGDGTRFLKLSFGSGEIDFIVGGSLTADPITLCEIAGELTLVETIPEIVTKKVVHRGASIKPRDVFDIAAASEHYSDQVVSALRHYPTQVATAIETVSRLNPDFLAGAIAELMIRDSHQNMAGSALRRTIEVLEAAS